MSFLTFYINLILQSVIEFIDTIHGIYTALIMFNFDPGFDFDFDLSDSTIDFANYTEEEPLDFSSDTKESPDALSDTEESLDTLPANEKPLDALPAIEETPSEVLSEIEEKAKNQTDIKTPQENHVAQNKVDLLDVTHLDRSIIAVPWENYDFSLNLENTLCPTITAPIIDVSTTVTQPELTTTSPTIVSTTVIQPKSSANTEHVKAYHPHLIIENGPSTAVKPTLDHQPCLINGFKPSANPLTILENQPQFVNGFNPSANPPTILDHRPQFVNGFNPSGNPLTILDHRPQFVNGFNPSGNPLTILDHRPQFVNGFNPSGNPLTILDHRPQFVNGFNPSANPPTILDNQFCFTSEPDPSANADKILDDQISALIASFPLLKAGRTVDDKVKALINSFPFLNPNHHHNRQTYRPRLSEIFNIENMTGSKSPVSDSSKTTYKRVYVEDEDESPVLGRCEITELDEEDEELPVKFLKYRNFSSPLQLAQRIKRNRERPPSPLDDEDPFTNNETEPDLLLFHKYQPNEKIPAKNMYEASVSYFREQYDQFYQHATNYNRSKQRLYQPPFFENQNYAPTNSMFPNGYPDKFVHGVPNPNYVQNQSVPSFYNYLMPQSFPELQQPNQNFASTSNGGPAYNNFGKAFNGQGPQKPIQNFDRNSNIDLLSHDLGKKFDEEKLQKSIHEEKLKKSIELARSGWKISLPRSVSEPTTTESTSKPSRQDFSTVPEANLSHPIYQVPVIEPGYRPPRQDFSSIPEANSSHPIYQVPVIEPGYKPTLQASSSVQENNLARPVLKHTVAESTPKLSPQAFGSALETNAGQPIHKLPVTEPTPKMTPQVLNSVPEASPSHPVIKNTNIKPPPKLPPHSSSSVTKSSPLRTSIEPPTSETLHRSSSYVTLPKLPVFEPLLEPPTIRPLQALEPVSKISTPKTSININIPPNASKVGQTSRAVPSTSKLNQTTGLAVGNKNTNDQGLVLEYESGPSHQPSEPKRKEKMSASKKMAQKAKSSGKLLKKWMKNVKKTLKSKD